MANLRSFVTSRLGARELNQDAFIADDSRGVFAVADGVSAGEMGEWASKYAVTQFLESSIDENPSIIMERTHRELIKESVDRFQVPVIGTTFTGLRIRDQEAEVVHIGDSRCYLIRDGTVTQLTRDHEAYDDSRGTACLISYLGIAPDVSDLTIDFGRIGLEKGDQILLCTDGLTHQVADHTLSHLISTRRDDPAGLVKELAALAENSRNSDNITIVLVEVA